LDLDKTTLYQDKKATAFYFPPDYSWQEISSPTAVSAAEKEFLKSFRFNDFEKLSADQRCLSDNCLEQKNQTLYYNGRVLARPTELNNQDIAAVSIGVLEKNFLVGFTVKNGSEYCGLVYYFNGQKFTPLNFPKEIVSPYYGVFGFGGVETDFLVIYGAYQGIAYHFQGDKVSDLNRFFEIRAMNQGFKAEIIRASQGTNINWYVFSLSTARPWLIKLWENQSGAVVGEAVFDNFFNSNESSAAFKLKQVSTDKIIILANLRRNYQDYWYLFTDRGFKNEKPGRLVFKPLYQGSDPTLITIKKLAAAVLDLDSPSLKTSQFLFSPDAKNWQTIPTEKNVDFSFPPLKQFFLQVNFPGLSDKFSSPFLDSVLFDYYYQK